MKAIIEEINDKLKNIISELETQKTEVDDSLNSVQEKIDAKIEEAKGYKTSVDTAKEEIKRLEDEIVSLEDDLKDLTNRFSGKDLNAILETGNKEINAKIAARQKDISKQKDRINELTEKARTIKDLLINLKKDKESKKYKLGNITEAYNYYEKELSRIIDFSTENPDDLNEYVIIPVEDDDTTDDSYEYQREVIDDRPIFDEIESIEKENEDDYSFSDDEVVEKDVAEEKINSDEQISQKNEFSEEEKEQELSYNNDEIDSDEIAENNDTNIDESNDSLMNFNFDFNLEDNLNEDGANSAFNLFSNNNESENNTIDFKTLNDTIDREYANIFGSSEDISLTSNPVVSLIDENNNFSDINNLFGSDPEFSSNIEETKIDEPNDEVVNFFKNNNLDFSKFSSEDQETLRSNFNLINYTKTLDILRKNNLKLENIYNASGVFKMIHSELETIINRLLLAGQTTQNISYVLNTLPLINSIDLDDVIKSYGPSIKDANITDLIIKAKHLKDIDGGK